MSSPAPDPEFPCKPCNLVFPSWEQLWDHKSAMRDQGREDHKTCAFCNERFEAAKSELLHVQRSHEPSHNLHCPGCGRGPFIRLAMLVGHIERGQCTGISSQDLIKLRETKLDFHRGLEKRSDGPIKGSFASYMSKIQVSQWIDISEAPSAEKPGQVSEVDFPGLPKSNEMKGPPSEKMIVEQDDQSLLIDLSSDLAVKWQTSTQGKGQTSQKDKSPPETSKSSSVTKWQGSWGTKDIQEALAKDREKGCIARPTLAAEVTRATPEYLADEMDMDDPEHPYFCASNYFCIGMNKYVCPKLGCGKCFDNQPAIIRHLKSPAHGDKSYQCPKCSRIFKSVEAISSHAESAGHCRVRETEHYGAFIDQLTGGIVGVDSSGRHGTVKYNANQSTDKVFW